MRVLVALLMLAGSGAWGAPPRPRKPLKNFQNEKESRTPAQQKIDSHLLFQIYFLRGEVAKGMPHPIEWRTDSKDRAFIDIRADPTPAMRKKVRSLGGAIEYAAGPPANTIFAWMPLLKLETLAEEPSVVWIQPKPEAHANPVGNAVMGGNVRNPR